MPSTLVDAAGRVEGEVLGQVADLAGDRDRAGASGAARRRASRSSVDLPEPLAPTRPERPGADEQVETVEDGRCRRAR